MTDPLETGTFAFGAATLPLAATDDPLLPDADPAIARAVAFFAWGIQNYVGARLLAVAAGYGLNPPSAVVTQITTEPSPWLYTSQMGWPILAVYRKRDLWTEQTVTWDLSTSTWEVAYVLPPLEPRAQDAINPVLRAVAMVLRRLAHQGYDPGYNGGAAVWGTDADGNALVHSVRLVEAVYGGYQKVDAVGNYYRALNATITAREREMPVEDAFPVYGGEDFHGDLASTVDATLADVASFATGPILVSVSPDTGTPAGGTAITLVGVGFVDGMTVTFDATSVATAFVDGNTATCTTPAHAAAIVDVTVTLPNGSSSKLSASFTYA